MRLQPTNACLTTLKLHRRTKLQRFLELWLRASTSYIHQLPVCWCAVPLIPLCMCVLHSLVNTEQCCQFCNGMQTCEVATFVQNSAFPEGRCNAYAECTPKAVADSKRISTCNLEVVVTLSNSNTCARTVRSPRPPSPAAPSICQALPAMICREAPSINLPRINSGEQCCDLCHATPQCTAAVYTPRLKTCTLYEQCALHPNGAVTTVYGTHGCLIQWGLASNAPPTQSSQIGHQ